MSDLLAIRHVRKVVQSRTITSDDVNDVAARYNITPVQVHVLRHFCTGLSDSAAAKRLRSVAAYTSAMAANAYISGQRQYRRHQRGAVTK